MSLKIMDAVFDKTMGSCTDKLVMLALADNASDEGFCWPSVATIARRTDLTERAVQKIIKRLGEQGLVERRYRKETSTIYHLFPNGIPPLYRGGEPRSPGGVNHVHQGVNHVHQGGEPRSPDPSLIRQGTVKGGGGPPLSATERIGLERELKENRTRLKSLDCDLFDATERAERKRLRDRNRAIEKALFIPLP